MTIYEVSSKYGLTNEPAALMVMNAASKDAANQEDTRWMKEEQMEVVVAFLSRCDFLPFSLLDLRRASAMHGWLLLSSC